MDFHHHNNKKHRNNHHSSSATTITTAYPPSDDPTHSWWESVSKARSRIHAFAAILLSSSSSFPIQHGVCEMAPFDAFSVDSCRYRSNADNDSGNSNFSRTTAVLFLYMRSFSVALSPTFTATFPPSPSLPRRCGRAGGFFPSYSPSSFSFPISLFGSSSLSL